MSLLDKVKQTKASKQKTTMSNNGIKKEGPQLSHSLVKEKVEQTTKNHEISDEIKKQIQGSVMRSVGVKLFFTIFFGVLLCVFMMGQFSSTTSEKIIEEQAIVSGENTIEQLGINLDNILKTYQDLSLSILIDQEFHKDLDRSINSSDDLEKLQALRSISTKLQNHMFSNDAVSGIALIPISDELTILTAGNSQVIKINEIKQEPWFTETLELNGQVNWIETRATSISSTSNAPSFGVSRVLKNTLTNQSDYILFFDISLKNLLATIERVGVTEGGEIAIVGKEMNYTVHADRAKISTPISFTFDKLDSVASKVMNIEGEDKLLIQTKINTNGWYLIETIPVHVLVEGALAIREMTIKVSIVAVVIALLIAGFVVFNISAPLVKIRNLLVQGADGNLTIRAKVTKRQDEIGQLARSFNLMMEKMGDLANRTKNSAEAVLSTAEILTQASHKTANSAREIAVATEEIANGATSLASEAERGTNITLTINGQMKSVLLANDEMKHSALQVEQASVQGAAYMSELINQTTDTEQLTRNMVDKVDTLSDSTRSIVQILDMLNAVNKQTNILSLNATIEAARAGSAGKGFMVVASEIRNLADQSSNSIEVVGQITDQIQAEIEQTANALTEVYPLFQQQVNAVKNANEIFSVVQLQMSGFIGKLEQVTESVNHLERTQTILNETMSNVSAVAEQSSATSQEVASLSNEQLSVSDNLVLLSQQLNEMSSVLKDSISKFKV